MIPPRRRSASPPSVRAGARLIHSRAGRRRRRATLQPLPLFATPPGRFRSFPASDSGRLGRSRHRDVKASGVLLRVPPVATSSRRLPPTAPSGRAGCSVSLLHLAHRATGHGRLLAAAMPKPAPTRLRSRAPRAMPPPDARCRCIGGASDEPGDACSIPHLPKPKPLPISGLPRQLTPVPAFAGAEREAPGPLFRFVVCDISWRGRVHAC